MGKSPRLLASAFNSRETGISSDSPLLAEQIGKINFRCQRGCSHRNLGGHTRGDRPAANACLDFPSRPGIEQRIESLEPFLLISILLGPVETCGFRTEADGNALVIGTHSHSLTGQRTGATPVPIVRIYHENVVAKQAIDTTSTASREGSTGRVYSPVWLWGAATPFDSGDSRWRRKIDRSTSTAVERNSLCQF